MKDLTEAISSNALATETEPGYVSVWGAKAILSRVYLNMMYLVMEFAVERLDIAIVGGIHFLGL